VIPRWVVAASIAVQGTALTVWHWLRQIFWGPRFWKIASEFLLEAAVLIAVFPILEEWINKGTVRIRWALGSELFAAGLLALAAIMASIEHGEE
jgi:hypothetical protein